MNTRSYFRRVVILVLVCLVGLLAVGGDVATAEEAGRAGSVYFHAGIGPSFVQDVTVVGFDDFESGRTQFDPGVRLELGFGYHVADWLSVELDTGFLMNFTTLRSEAGWDDEFGFYQVPIMANVILHIPTGSRFHPFIGAGFGGVSSTLEDYDFFSTGSEEDFGIAWQGVAGCRYQFSTRFELGIAYKYLGTTGREFESLGVRLEGIQTHSVTLSMSVGF